MPNSQPTSAVDIRDATVGQYQTPAREAAIGDDALANYSGVQPKLSIVIPTYNRGKLAAYAIRSAAAQVLPSCLGAVFSDKFVQQPILEVVVSDNSTESFHQAEVDRAVTEIRDELESTSRLIVRLVRPQRFLNMADSWEFATQHARGEYVAILSDHYVLRPSAVGIWLSLIDQHNPDILFSCVRSGFDMRTGLQRTANSTGSVTLNSAKKVLEDFLRFDAWDDDSMLSFPMPRGMNSVYRASLAESIRRRHGIMCQPLSPDYTSAFFLMAEADTVLHVDMPFYCSYGYQSNGSSCVLNGVAKFVATFPDLDPFEYCPVRVEAVQNTLYRDFESIRRQEPRLQDFAIDPAGYYLSLHRELLLKEKLGSPVNLRQMRSIWKQGVAMLASRDRARVLAGREQLNRRRVAFPSLRRALRRVGIDPTFRSSKQFLKAIRSRVNGENRYADPLDAAVSTDDLLRNNRPAPLG